ncbi:hypothetical protein KIN20_026537 [Parelaphostrongylus tenuis]|uniref:Uncharacterized protein n=1 Tax=Parelaphostrongylus tenuis TaxID=148309 RepID=A0AAD5QY64_PARTN|nr:hypothetical protein KIN20_026537 [Parelaphostrongylus tenuis]
MGSLEKLNIRFHWSQGWHQQENKAQKKTAIQELKDFSGSVPQSDHFRLPR